MGDQHDYLALDWVKGEIEETLKQAQQSLEAYVENPEDSTRMRFCLTYLHQVYGTLQMVEFYGAALLAEEMEKLAQAILSGKVSRDDEARELLMRGILQLPKYLDRVKQGRQDHPVIVLPLLNDLRAARGESLLSETALFKPDLESGSSAGEEEGSDEAIPDIHILLRKIRQLYQFALVGIIRNQDLATNVGYLAKALARLERLSGNAPIRQLWWVASAVVEGVSNHSIELGTSVKMLLGLVDRQIKEVAEEEIVDPEREVPVDLLKNLLYYVAKSEADSPRIRSVKEAFRLEESLPGDLDRERQMMMGPDREAMVSVVDAISEELSRCKDTLDLFVRGESKDLGDLKELIPTLKQVSDTLAVLGLGMPRRIIQEQIDAVGRILDAGTIPDDSVFMDIAGAFLYVEATLNGIASDRRVPEEGEEETDAAAVISPEQLGKAKEAVLRESRAGLESAKEGIIEFIASQWDQFHLKTVPDTLNSVRGGLSMIPLKRPAALLQCCVRYIEEKLLESEDSPDWRDMDTLADAITSVEYYLERLSEDNGDNEHILEIAEESVASLGYPLTEEAVAAQPEPGETIEEADLDIQDAASEEPVADAGEAAPEEEVAGLAEAEAGSEPEAVTSEDTEEVEPIESTAEDFEVEDVEGVEADSEEQAEDDTAEEPSFEVEEDEPAMDLDNFDFEGEMALEQPEDAGFDFETEAETDSEPEATAEPEADEESVAMEEEEPQAAEPAMDFDDEDDEEEDDLIDDEIIEIFVEEAGEVMDTFRELFPKWQANWEDNDAMTDIRRAFHTLKGSGRMVGASVVGELAWSIENMMNRVLDNTIELTDTTMELIGRVIDIVPPLVEDFNARRKASVDTAPYEAVAWEIAKGGSVDDLDAHLGEAAVSEAAPEAEEAAQSSAEEAGFDPQLLEIFRNEALSHLNELEALLGEFGGEPMPFPNNVLRAMHTLKGSANMAGIEPIAEVASPAEKFVKTLHTQGTPMDKELHQLLTELVRIIHVGIDQLETHPQQSVPERDAFLSLLESLRERYLGQKGHDILDTSSYVPKVDPQLVEIFLAEGMDLILDAANVLDQWQRNPVPGEQLDALRNELTILSRSAKAAQLHEVEELSHALGRCYDAVTEGRFHPNEAFFELAHEGHEKLIEMMDRLAAGQFPQPAKETVMALIGCLEEGLESEPAEHEAAEADTEETAPAMEVEDDDEETIEIDEEALADSELDNYGVDEPSEPTPQPQQPAPAFEAEDFDSESDQELVEIFLEEASDIIENTSHALQRWIEDPNNRDEVEELQRDLHTLKGGARLAEITQIGDLAHQMENVYEAVCEMRMDPSDAMFDLMNRCHDQLAVMVESLQANGNCEPAPALVDEITGFVKSGGVAQTAASAAPQQEPADTETSDAEPAEEPADLSGASEDFEAAAEELSQDEEFDPEILEIFLDEAEELAEGIDHAIQAWNKEREETAHIDELQRLLHTLKGGARLAGLKDLGDISHDFETYITDAQNQDRLEDEEVFKAVQERHDNLVNFVDGLRKKITQMVDEAHAKQEEDEKESQLPANVTPMPKRKRDDMVEVSASGDWKPAQPQPEPQPQQQRRGPQEMIKVPAQLLETLVNLAGETSIFRGRIEQEVSDFTHTIEEMTMTIDRLREQLRRMDLETEATILSRHMQEQTDYDEDFDPLEMDRYSALNQLSRSLSESASDLVDLKDTLNNRTRDAETLLLQQSRINTELQEGLMRTRMVPFSRLTPRLRRIVRQVGAELGKQVDLEVVNAEGEMDRNILERMVPPLEHMLRNAVDHGLETPEQRQEKGKKDTGRITLHLTREGSEVVLRLSDDGKGIDLEGVRKRALERGLMTEDTQLSDTEIMQFIFRSGFSTAAEVTQLSGRGVGMDVVYSEIKQLGGSLKIHSAKDVGSQFTIRLPFTVAVNRALMVRVGEDAYAIPLNNIEGIVRVSPYELETYYEEDAPMFDYAGQSYRMRYLGTFVHGIHRPLLQGLSKPLPVLLVRGGDKPVALQVDSLIGSREVVVKTVGPQLSAVSGISGATILGDGSVVIILDLLALIRSEHVTEQEARARAEEEAEERRIAAEERNRRKVVMVVDDSVTVRKVTGRLLERHGYDVVTARDGVDAITQLQEHNPDVMLLDIEMPRMDGFEVASLVRHDSRLKDLPIIMITSRTGEKHRERAYSIGVNQYMGKPYQETQLLDSIRELLNQSPQRQHA